MQANKRVLIIGEALIPLLGYFFWNWNLYFIFLFMFLDLSAYNVLYFFKYRNILKYNQLPDNNFLLLSHLLALFLLSILMFFGYTYVLNAVQQTFYRLEIIRFLKYEDMGFAQGYILLPLIVLTAFMNYKTEFILQRQFEKLRIRELFMSYLKDNFAAVILLLGFLLSYALGIKNEQFFFYTGLGIYFGYRFFSLRKEEG
ncbi:MAG: hypothetical protein J0G96_12865 [Flavobacteriia bacterium]|nr:hypothetical protein [Flavobacteriia bacterium]OJX36207.1 MAG: hypothetical protein BGO87_07020 [Flavobacteriia bacterium 40-80]